MQPVFGNMARRAPILSQTSQTHPSLHEWPRAPGLAAEPPELALVVLDRFGVVDNCNAAARKLFGAALPGMLGQHVNCVIPGMPLRHGTPGYNLAYAAYWSSHAHYRRFTGIDCRGNAFDLDVRLDRLLPNGNPHILLDLKQPMRSVQESGYAPLFLPATEEHPACC